MEVVEEGMVRASTAKGVIITRRHATVTVVLLVEVEGHPDTPLAAWVVLLLWRGRTRLILLCAPIPSRLGCLIPPCPPTTLEAVEEEVEEGIGRMC